MVAASPSKTVVVAAATPQEDAAEEVVAAPANTRLNTKGDNGLVSNLAPKCHELRLERSIFLLLATRMELGLCEARLQVVDLPLESLELTLHELFEVDGLP